MEPQKITLNSNQFTINTDSSGFCKNYIEQENSQNNGPENIIVSIEAASFDDHALLEAFASDIRSEFFKNKNTDIKTRFEKTIGSVDLKIKKNKVLAGKLNILIAASFNNELLFSKYGQMYACIFKNGQLINISPRNRKITNAVKTSLKAFPYIIGGQLESDDKLIFFNEPVGNICDLEQLEALLENDPNKNFEEFQSYLKNYLAKNGRSENPLFVLLYPQIYTQQAAKEKKQKAHKTIDVPQISPTQAAVTVSSQTPEILNGVTIATESAPQSSNISDKINELKDKISIPQISIKVPEIIKSINVSDLTDKAQQISSQLISDFSNTKKLNNKNKVVIALVALILIVSSVQIYRKVSAKNQFNDLTDQINKSKNEAVALISNNQIDLAITKLIEAKNLSSSISSQLPGFTDKSQELSAEIETELNKAARITVIDNPEKISELSNFGIKFVPQGLIRSDDQIIITGSDFGLAYKIDLETKRRGFSFFSTIEDSVIDTIKSQSAIAFFTDKNLFIYDPQKKNIADFEFVKKDNQAFAMDGKTIAILDKDAGQVNIVSKSNFSSTGKISLDSRIKGISSNGTNFLALTEDNKIIKVSSKQDQIADLNLTLPLLNSPDMIIGNQNNGNIYVVNRSDKQIAAFSETGEFIRQYDLKGFEKITDLFIDDNEIFILAPDAVFKISI